MSRLFDAQCERCPRLAAHLRRMRTTHPTYFNAPVPAFGDLEAPLLIVGLAPGMHGANATGRPFTGDYAGILLYAALHALGLATAHESTSADDGLRLIDCRITNAVKCLPPQNKPTTAEADTCNDFLRAELAGSAAAVVLALGSIAHRAVLRALGLRLSQWPFGHGARHEIHTRRVLIDSYHCSRYNTQTRRLTEAMFLDVLKAARDESQLLR
ncbi:MAG TPA: uracil-DNA glycosylase [Gammaproteobacteria bacterium]|nr:uracil-DNA glycosylase [Gammaproteobacteria bacterium]